MPILVLNYHLGYLNPNHDKDLCDTYLELAKFDVPILPFPMPSAGSTGPASLYSDTAVANEELPSEA